MLTRLTDLDAAKWILEGRESQTSRPYTPARVRNCLPSVFRGYAKLFHPIWTDKRVTDRTISWHEAESGRISSVGVSLGGTLRNQTPDEAYIGDRLLWRDLAQRYGLVFHAEVNDASFTQNFPGKSWPRYLFGPDEGRLDTATCDALISILNGVSKNNACYFYYGGLQVWAGTDDYFQPRLYKGSIDDVHTLWDSGDFNASPEFWWPVDQSWCINTDYDLTFTLIGGPEALLADIAKNEWLETLPVEPTSRVDIRADQVNHKYEEEPNSR